MDDKFANVMPSRVTKNDEPVMPKSTHKTSDASNASDVSVPQSHRPSLADDKNVNGMPVSEHPVVQEPVMDASRSPQAVEQPDTSSFFNTDSPSVDVSGREHYSYGEPTPDAMGDMAENMSSDGRMPDAFSNGANRMDGVREGTSGSAEKMSGGSGAEGTSAGGNYTFGGDLPKDGVSNASPNKVFDNLTGDSSPMGGTTGPKTLGEYASNAVKGAGRSVLSFARTLGSLVSSGMTSIATSLGTSVKVVKTAAGVLGITGVVFTGSLFLGIFNEEARIRYEEDDCSVIRDKANSNLDSQMDNYDRTAVAREIYKALASDSVGFTDQFIAGLLANADAESSMNPACYEGMNYEEVKGKQKWDEYTLALVKRYNDHGKTVKLDGYRMPDGHYLPGFGLWQWTKGRAYNLMQFAGSVEQQQTGTITDNDGDGYSDRIYDLDIQLAYLLKENEGRKSDGGVVGMGREGSKTLTPTECAAWFWLTWERGGSGAGHVASAETWYDMITSQGWATDNTYGNSIIQMAQIDLAEAGARGILAAYANTACQELDDSWGLFDNSSVAAAAVSWAVPGLNDNYDRLPAHPEYANTGYSSVAYDRYCTDLYVACHNLVSGGPAYASCDNGGGTAVRASGTDDNIPMGPCSAQFTYLSSSDKWQDLGAFSWAKKDQYQPGDFICGWKYHTLIYVGPDLVAQKWPSLFKATDSNIKYATIESSYHTCGPCLRYLYSDMEKVLINSDGINCGHYHVFRAKGKESDSKRQAKIEAYKAVLATYENGSKPATRVHSNMSSMYSAPK